MTRTELIGFPFDPETQRSAVERCISWCQGERAPHTVITANASHLCMMRHDTKLDQACRAGDLIVADGMSVVWAARLAGVPIPERVAGVDLMTNLLEAAGQHGLRVFFLGAKPEVVSTLAALAVKNYPGLVVAGTRDGYFKPADHAAIVEEIRAAKPHMLFIGMPSPFKETFAEQHRERLDVPVMVGVGGSFDVIAGFIQRAPRPVQKMGMEWAWRLAMEPRKLFMRYLKTNSEFIWLASREIVARRLGRPAAARSGS